MDDMLTFEVALPSTGKPYTGELEGGLTIRFEVPPADSKAT